MPDIKNLNQGAVIRSKALEKTISLKLDQEEFKEYAHNNMGERMRKSEPDSRRLKKKGINKLNFNKDDIFAKIESGRSKIL